MVTETFRVLGLTPTLGVSAHCDPRHRYSAEERLVLLAKKRVGYTVAQVATDLRLSLLRALLDNPKWEYYLRQPVGVLIA